MKKTGKFCSACKYKNPQDAIFCAYCGTPFSDEDSPNTTRRVAESTTTPTNELVSRQAQAEGKPEAGISFYVLGDPHPIESRNETIVVLGRRADTSIIDETLLDLSTYGAFAMGVSRRHAVVQKNNNGYEIADMDSANGTWLNEQRMVPKKFYPLHSGARIRLGKLVLLVACHQ